jgi:cytochrome c-type biogenesis protein CcmF
LSGGLIAIFRAALREDTLMRRSRRRRRSALVSSPSCLFSSNPFNRLPVAPPDGQGLNPLLQDPGLAFHPPTLYVGYVGLSVAFSFAVGALITREIGAGFCARDAAVGAGKLDFPDARHHGGQLLGLL